MRHMPLQEPTGYRDLCQRLQVERDPAKFRQTLEEIDRLLRDHEKSSALSLCEPISLRRSFERT